MKIDEPKTPYAPRYDPSQDDEEEEERGQVEMAEAEDSLIDAQDVKVDELDNKKVTRRPVTEEEIPELELGEAEEPVSSSAGDDERIVRDRRMSSDSGKGEKHVVVGGGEGGDAADEDRLLTPEEAEVKHRKFEQQRKKHYEMRNVKEILAWVSVPTYIA